MKHLFLILLLASFISPAFAQKAKAGKYNKARIKTEIAKLPSTYNSIPETMPAVSIPTQPQVYIIGGSEGCRLQGLNIGCARPDETLYVIDVNLVGRNRENICIAQLDQILVLENGLSAKYSGIPEDDNRYKQF